ncbi:endochitinase A [Eurytemora carolleeae]|uniref:endochitinase A n=1 Tax=Eurytemora carolleeae TaxID=1294199 RepID=UPI000C77DA34|nr:endochitinase A [Eurytemora carolleeae]|eukprot:XP_023337264.1 endochitinase A-like [Eurytemora affinis]
MWVLRFSITYFCILNVFGEDCIDPSCYETSVEYNTLSQVEKTFYFVASYQECSCQCADISGCTAFTWRKEFIYISCHCITESNPKSQKNRYSTSGVYNCKINATSSSTTTSMYTFSSTETVDTKSPIQPTTPDVKSPNEITTTTQSQSPNEPITPDSTSSPNEPITPDSTSSPNNWKPFFII